MIKITGFLIVFLALSAMLGLSACERTLSGKERAAVLDFSEPVADNLFAGWNAGDYAMFSRDFDKDMQEQLPAGTFTTLIMDWDDKLGDYLSRTVESVMQADEFYVVTYQVKFEQENPVKLTVAFHKSHTIAFLGFDSEKVSWSAFQ